MDHLEALFAATAHPETPIERAAKAFIAAKMASELAEARCEHARWASRGASATDKARKRTVHHTAIRACAAANAALAIARSALSTLEARPGSYFEA